MSGSRAIPFWLKTLILVGIIIPFLWKFAPLIQRHLPKDELPPGSPPASLLTETRQQEQPASVTLTPEEKEILAAIAESEPQATPAASPIPNPVSAPLSGEPTYEQFCAFLETYIGAATSNEGALNDSFLKFPLQYFDSVVDREQWRTNQAKYIQSTPERKYIIMGDPIIYKNRENAWKVILAIIYSVKRTTGEVIEGVSLDELGLTLADGRLQISKHIQLQRRLLLKDGRGPGLDGYSAGTTAWTSDGTVNLRSSASKAGGNIITALKTGTRLLFWSQPDQDWQFVVTDTGTPGFIDKKLIVPYRP